MLKRMFCILLAAALLAIGCAAEETANAPYTLAGFDDTQYRSWQDNRFFARMEEKTGVQFDLVQYTDASAWAKAKTDMTAGADLPDVLFKADLTGAECMELMEKGVLCDLKPYLADCCPNLWAILSAHPEYLEAITLPDGSVPALPYITAMPVQNYLWINEAFLKNLGLKAPTTAEELTAVLTAFRDNDPNRNGKKDEIPLGFLGPFDLKFLAHAYGLIANDYNVFVRDGQVRFMPLEEEYRPFVEWCRELYKEKLLDKNGFTLTSMMRQVTDEKAAENYGMIIYPAAADVFRVPWATDYAIMEPLFHEGKQVYRDFAGPLLRGTFAVTTHCDDVEKMLRWVDTLYTEEGAVLASIGKEYEDYLVDGDGTWRLTDAVKNDGYFTITSLIDGGGTTPGILADAFQRRFSGNPALQITLEQQERFNEKTRQPFPYYFLSKAQEEEIGPMQDAIGYYVDMQLARWVLGEEPITDESFAAFESELNGLGLPRFLAFWQEVLDNR